MDNAQSKTYQITYGSFKKIYMTVMLHCRQTYTHTRLKNT